MPSLPPTLTLLVYTLIFMLCINSRIGFAQSTTFEVNLMISSKQDNFQQWSSLALLAAQEVSSSWNTDSLIVNVYDHQDSEILVTQLNQQTAMNASVLATIFASKQFLVDQTALQLFLPKVAVLSPVSRSTFLSSVPENFFSLVSPQNYSISVLAQTLSHYGWTKVGVIYSDDEEGVRYFNDTRNIVGAQVFGRSVPPSSETFDEVVKFIWKNSLNILVVVLKDPVQISNLLTAAQQANLFSKGRAWLILEIEPSLISNPPLGTIFVKTQDGNISSVANFTNMMKALDDSIYLGCGADSFLYPHSMHIYDSVKTIANAIDQSRAFGVNRENILSALSNSFSLVGVSGQIEFSNGFRVSMPSTIFNYQQNNQMVFLHESHDLSSFETLTQPIFPGSSSDCPDDQVDTIPIAFFQPLSARILANPGGIRSLLSFVQDYINFNRSDLPPNTRMEFVVIDSKGSASTSIKAAIPLSDYGVGGVIGEYYTDVTEAIQNVISPFGIPQISTVTATPGLSDKTNFPTYFRLVPSDLTQAKALIDLCLHYEWTEIHVLSSTDPFSSGISQTFTNLASENNIKIISRTVLPDTNTNYDSELKQIKEMKPRIIAALVGLPVVERLAKSINDVKLTAKAWISPNAINTIYTVSGIVQNASIFDHWITINHVPASGTRYLQILDYLSNNSAYYPGAASIWNSTGPSHGRILDAAETFCRAMKSVIEAGGSAINGSAVKNQLLLTHITDGVTGNITFDDQGDRIGEYVVLNLLKSTPVQIGRWTQSAGISLSNAAIFPDGTTNVPTSTLPRPQLWLRWTSVAGVILSILAALGIIATLLFSIIILNHRDSPIIRTATFPFLLVMLFGIAIGYGSIFTWIGRPQAWICALRIWLPPCAFILITAPLLTKTWRLHRIFTLSSYKLVQLPLHKLAAITSVIVLVQVIICIIWVSLGTIQPEIVDDQNNYRSYVICSHNRANRIMNYITFAYAGILMVCGTYLAFRVRKLPKDFNESRWIGFSIYNSFIFSLLTLILGYTLASFRVAVLIFICVCTLAISTGALFFMLLPKAWKLLRNPEKPRERSKTGTSDLRALESIAPIGKQSTTNTTSSRHDYSLSTMKKKSRVESKD